MIKNNGGVFGRNPTFNNVEVEGDLTVDGSIIGTIVAEAGTLTGHTLAANVVDSSLTSVGILENLTVTNSISGSITGNAATATTATSATTATTAGTVTTAAQPAITSVGTLTSINTSGVITGTNTTASTSSTTGAVIIAGGVGIAKDSFVNGLRVGIGGTGTGLVTSNAAFGKDALTGNTGTATIGIGENAGSGNTGGSNCVFIGQNSGVSNTANSTLGIGTYSMYQNTGSACVGVGIDALYSNNGDHCVAIGYATLAYNGIGNQGVSNTAIGYFAGNVNSSGARSTFIGRDAGVLNTTGSDQVFIGSDAGDICTTGTQNTVLGSQADLAANNNNNSIVIGYNAVGLGTNTTVIGNSSTTETKLFGQLTLDATACISAASATSLALKTVVPAGTGVTPTLQVICPSSATALTNVNTSQNVFSTTSIDQIALQAATTYMFDGVYIIKTTGTSTHTISMSFITSATFNNFSFSTLSHALAAPPVAASGTQYTNFFASGAGGAVNATNATAYNIVKFQGIMRVNAAGAIVPQITFNIAPGGTNTLEIGSYLNFYPLGSNTINSVGTAIS